MLANGIIWRIDVDTYLARLVGRVISVISVIVALLADRGGDTVSWRNECVLFRARKIGVVVVGSCIRKTTMELCSFG